MQANMPMELNSTPNLTNIDVLTLLDEARTAEKHREIQRLQEILQAVWDDIGAEPDYEKYEPLIKAELYRLSGAFLTLYASSQVLKDIHLRAKDLLTKSIGIFEHLNLREKVGEANLWLGYVYGNCGEVKEYEDIYNCIEAEFEPNHPIQFKVIINRLRIFELANKNEEAEKLLEKHLHRFAECTDLPLKAMLHNNAAIIYRRSGNLFAAAEHYNLAIKLSQETKILLFEASNLNNLAFVYRDLEKFEEAHASAKNALQIFISVGDKGSIPKILDTEALIFLAEKKYELALQSAEDALRHFLEGEDFNCITDSYWTKILCLLRLERGEDAFIEYGKLQHIAAAQIGDVAVKKFARLMREQVYVPLDVPLPEKIKAFIKLYAKRGLLQNGLKVTKTAKALGFTHHEPFRKILKKLPEIYDELGMPRPKTRVSKKKKAADKKVGHHDYLGPEFIRNDYLKHDPGSRSIFLEPGQIREEKIYEVTYENVDFSFDFDYDSDVIDTYYFGKNWMKKFGIFDDCVIAITPPSEFRTGAIVLIWHEDRYLAGQIEYSSYEGIYFIEHEQHGPIPITADDVIGVPVGYCRADDAVGDKIQFTRLKMT